MTGDLVALERDGSAYGGAVVRVPGDEALRLLRQQVGRCPVCGFDLDLHTGGEPCPSRLRTPIHARSV
jgi:hypothetical protein